MILAAYTSSPIFCSPPTSLCLPYPHLFPQNLGDFILFMAFSEAIIPHMTQVERGEGLPCPQCEWGPASPLATHIHSLRGNYWQLDMEK